MGTMLIVGALGAGLAFLLPFLIRTKDPRPAWQALARDLSLTDAHGGRGLPRLVGEREGLSISIELVTRRVGDSVTDAVRFVVSGADLARGITAAREHVLADIQQLLGTHDVPSGDDDFDRSVHLRGDEAAVLAAMNARLREELQRLVLLSPHAHVSSTGEIVCERPGFAVHPTEDAYLVRRMLSVASALKTEAHAVAQRLAHNVIEDPLPAVRRRNLAVLGRDFPDDDETRRAATHAIEDADPALRVVAARALGGTRGFVALQAIAEDPSAAPDDRRAALELLLEKWPYAQVSPLLENALRIRDPELRLVAVHAIGRARDVERFDDVLRLSTQGSVALSEAVAETLGLVGDARAETALLEFLADPETSVRIAAARSLARIGTVNAVEPLLAHTKGITTPGALKDAARDAIRRIQARIGNADSGRLSVIDDDRSGAVSLVDDGGEIAMVDDTPGASRKRERS